jgi:hypothetical protein
MGYTIPLSYLEYSIDGPFLDATHDDLANLNMLIFQQTVTN